MTEDRLPLAELLEKAFDFEFMLALEDAVIHILMESDVECMICAGRHERSVDRLNYRNGYRDRTLDTRLGTLALRVPKLRQGSLFPAVSGAAQDEREGPGRGDPRGLDRWRGEPPGGRTS